MGLQASSSSSRFLQTSLQMTPFLGAALSLGVMACDVHSIHATIKSLKEPSDVVLALKRIEKTFPLVPTSVETEALLLLDAIRELRLLQKQVREHCLTPVSEDDKENQSENHTDRVRNHKSPFGRVPFGRNLRVRSKQP
jgi:hypothetical protein